MHVENHIGPIRIKLISGRGRGIVTTRKVKAGELLVRFFFFFPLFFFGD